jgi:hypothetical protein
MVVFTLTACDKQYTSYLLVYRPHSAGVEVAHIFLSTTDIAKTPSSPARLLEGRPAPQPVSRKLRLFLPCRVTFPVLLPRQPASFSNLPEMRPCCHLKNDTGLTLDKAVTS